MIVKEKNEMKRLICILLCITFLFSMSACDVRLNTTGDVKNVKVEKWEASKIYSDDEINAPIQKTVATQTTVFSCSFFQFLAKPAKLFHCQCFGSDGGGEVCGFDRFDDRRLRDSRACAYSV